MPLTRRARDFKADAIADARELQRTEGGSTYVFGVEFDAMKEPYPHRVMRYELGVDEVPRKRGRVVHVEPMPAPPVLTPFEIRKGRRERKRQAA